MTETGYFNSKANKLFYVCTPPHKRKEGAGIIFVHAANGNRLGPHRMFVELAQRVCLLGFATMRFDLRGCGDSTGLASRDQIGPDIEDLLSALEFFVLRYNLKKTFLFGISRGAWVSFATIAKNTVDVCGVVCLSAPSPSRKAAAKSFSNRLKEYLCKLTDSENLKKLLTGKANIKQIVKTMTFALSTNRRYSQGQNKDVETKCPLLFIYGQKDPTAPNHRFFYSNICNKFKIPYEIIEIQNANHSFFHYKWKEQIFEHVEKWLMENLRDGETEDAKSFLQSWSDTKHLL